MRGVIVLVVALAAAAAAVSSQVERSEAVAPPGVYSGLGSQRLAVVLTVARDGRALGVDVDRVARCSGDGHRSHLPITQTRRPAATSIGDDGLVAGRHGARR